MLLDMRRALRCHAMSKWSSKRIQNPAEESSRACFVKATLLR